MQWLKRKLRSWVNDAEGYALDKNMKLSTVHESIDHDFDEPLRFTISKANGGTIISTRRYDRRKDQNQGDIYIITDEQVLSDEIGKIVSMEMLKF